VCLLQLAPRNVHGRSRPRCPDALHDTKLASSRATPSPTRTPRKRTHHLANQPRMSYNNPCRSHVAYDADTPPASAEGVSNDNA
jgi:hypothetical protein